MAILTDPQVSCQIRLKPPYMSFVFFLKVYYITDLPLVLFREVPVSSVMQR